MSERKVSEDQRRHPGRFHTSVGGLSIAVEPIMAVRRNGTEYTVCAECGRTIHYSPSRSGLPEWVHSGKAIVGPDGGHAENELRAEWGDR